MKSAGASELDRLLLDSAREANILALTSRCDSHCVFCSHLNNPPQVKTVSIGTRSLDEVARTLAFLDAAQVITIGESATRIIEGEPFLHPRFAEIIGLVRRAFPETPLEITTNGRRLTEEMVALLRSAGLVSLHVSLNSASPPGRRALMGDTVAEAERTLTGVRRLAPGDVRFEGSLVALPHITGWDDLRETVAFLDENGAAAVRVIMPAFSAAAAPGMLPGAGQLHQQLRHFVDTVAPGCRCPVLLEPSWVSDLTPVVSGVLRGSSSWEGGLRRGDVVESVNGMRPRCRVEAWRLLGSPGAVSVEVRNGEHGGLVAWTNEPGVDPGLTMEYDFDPGRTERLGERITGRPGRSVLLTSELGYAVVRAVLELLGVDRDRAEAVKVPNRTFGGTIGAAGLLTVDDYSAALAAWEEEGGRAAQVIVPLESFDFRGFDLTGRHFAELEGPAGAPVVVE